MLALLNRGLILLATVLALSTCSRTNAQTTVASLPKSADLAESNLQAEVLLMEINEYKSRYKAIFRAIIAIELLANPGDESQKQSRDELINQQKKILNEIRNKSSKLRDLLEKKEEKERHEIAIREQTERKRVLADQELSLRQAEEQRRQALAARDQAVAVARQEEEKARQQAIAAELEARQQMLKATEAEKVQQKAIDAKLAIVKQAEEIKAMVEQQNRLEQLRRQLEQRLLGSEKQVAEETKAANNDPEKLQRVKRSSEAARQLHLAAIKQTQEQAVLLQKQKQEKTQQLQKELAEFRSGSDAPEQQLKAINDHIKAVEQNAINPDRNVLLKRLRDKREELLAKAKALPAQAPEAVKAQISQAENQIAALNQRLQEIKLQARNPDNDPVFKQMLQKKAEIEKAAQAMREQSKSRQPDSTDPKALIEQLVKTQSTIIERLERMESKLDGLAKQLENRPNSSPGK